MTYYALTIIKWLSIIWLVSTILILWVAYRRYKKSFEREDSYYD